jgi:plasmid stabilization system protein ParE
MSYTLHPEAERDVANALDFYGEHAGAAVAERFLDEFERVVGLLVAYPGLGTSTANGRKTFPLRLFPYSVIYREREGDIRILVVRHQHRKPGYGGARR